MNLGSAGGADGQVLALITSRSSGETPDMIEVICNDRVGRKVRVKCLPEDTIGEFKQVLALQIGVKPERLVLKQGYMTYKDHISLDDYEVHDQSMLELYYS